jgi:hypothetical protein
MTSMFRILISLRMVVACLAILMVLVFWGTLYQVRFGLFAAQEKFFYSWIFFQFGWMPLPGAQLVLAILFVNLTASMLFRFRFGWRQTGIIFIHLGLLLLLAGGWYTHHFGEESYLALVEGEGSNLTSDYRNWELSLSNSIDVEREITGFDTRGSSAGTIFRAERFGLEIKAGLYHANCRAFQGGESSNTVNASNITSFQPERRNKDPEADVPGMTCTVRDSAGEETDLLLFGGDPIPTRIETADGPVYFQLRRKRYQLPVFIRLLEFERSYHTGSNTAKSFDSRIEVHVGDVVREVLVEMNKPFRFQGYTFFQASFEALDSGVELSQFAVTRNFGRLIPYFATGFTVVGLAVHFLMQMAIRRK